MHDLPEKIDPRQWITSGPLVTPERAAKGDLTVHRRAAPTKLQQSRGEAGDIRDAQAHVRNVMNALHDRGVLGHQHVHDGETFEMWQMWFTAELSCRPSSIFASEVRGIRRALADDDLAHDDYAKLCRGMSRQQLGLVERAIKTPAGEHELWLATKDAEHYRRAFDRLSTVMGRLREEFNARKEAEARRLEDEAR